MRQDQVYTSRIPCAAASTSVDISDNGLGTGVHLNLLHPDYLHVAPLQTVVRLKRAVERTLKTCGCRGQHDSPTLAAPVSEPTEHIGRSRLEAGRIHGQRRL